MIDVEASAISPGDERPAGYARNAADDLEENILMQRVELEGQEIVWLIWQRYYKELYGSCLKWLDGDVQAAADISGDLLLKLYGKLPGQARSIANLKGWLMRLTYTACMDWHRRQGRHSKRYCSIDLLIRDGTDADTATVPSPDQHLIERETVATIQRALDNLPERLRVAAVMRLVHGESYDTIAAYLQLNKATARKRLQEARRVLKASLIASEIA